MNGYVLCSLDPGGQSDPAGLVVLNVFKRDRLTFAKAMHLEVRPPIMTPTAHIDFVQKTMTKVLTNIGRPMVRYIVDISNNSSIAYLLASALPKNSLIGVRISGGDAHGAGLTPFMVGDLAGRAAAIPVMTLSRRQLLLDVGTAFSTKVLTLPLDDPEQAAGVAELKRQMGRASLKITPSGKQIAVVQRSHDDLLLALAQGWAATRLPPPRDNRTSKEHARPAVSSAAWT